MRWEERHGTTYLAESAGEELLAEAGVVREMLRKADDVASLRADLDDWKRLWDEQTIHVCECKREIAILKVQVAELRAVLATLRGANR